MGLVVFLLVCSYLAGSIPFGLLFGKCAGIDVRAGGSGNIGATNVNRLAGKKPGVLTLFADIMKGFVPPMVAVAVVNGGPAAMWLPPACGLTAFLGHLYPAWLGFKGGKGVATALGVFVFLSPIATLVTIAVFAVVVASCRFVSLGSILAAAAMPLVLLFMGAPRQQVMLALVITTLIWLKHRTNIHRLIKGMEPRLGEKRSVPSEQKRPT